MITVTRALKVVEGDNKGRFPFCNCLYIDDDVKAIIDTGCGEGVLKSERINPEKVILSHYHLDHIRDTASLSLPVFCHPADILPAENEEALLYYTGFSELMNHEAQHILKFLQYRPVEITGSFSHGDVLDFGRTKLQVIHTPGHSPGHCCFYEEKEGVLFSADIDLTSFGPWYGHNSAEIDAFEDSIRLVMQINPAVIISSHKEVLREGIPQALQAYLDKIRERDDALLECLAKPATLEELVDMKFMYGKHPDPVPLFRHFERKIVKKHLDRLYTRGQVQLAGEHYRRVEKRHKFFTA
jgi:glyoxylase-like metal-dependent hydrolase (beta-lactamase superfamily II)